MSTIHILGIDLGKHCFHAVGNNHSGKEVIRRKFNRSQLLRFLSVLEPATVAFEACGGAHWLARILTNLKSQDAFLSSFSNAELSRGELSFSNVKNKAHPKPFDVNQSGTKVQTQTQSRGFSL